MIAEAVVYNWPMAVTILGVSCMLCTVIITFIIQEANRDVREMSEELTEYPTTNYCSETTTEIDRDAIKEVLKEMGYPECTADGKDALVSALNRDYSALLKRVDEISSRASGPVGLTETDKE